MMHRALSSLGVSPWSLPDPLSAGKPRANVRSHLGRTMNTRFVFFCALVSTAMVGMDTVHGANITVTNTNDNGPGSLRQALADAHDGDTIIFSVSGTISIVRGGY